MIATFEEAQRYLYSHIPKSETRKFPGEQGIARMRALLKILGDPQNNYRVIHIAGTSGKGSTATLTNCALVGQGFRTGLHLSPHLLDIRERVQVDTELISKEKFVQYLNEITPAVEQISKGDFGRVTYFEVLVALAYYSFWKENVDYAVMETGMGGLYDGTNVVTREDKLAVITKIGFDHMAVLGNTLEEITTQKAGIIHPGNTVITAPQESSVQTVLVDHAAKNDADLITISPQDFVVNSVSTEGTVFTDAKRNREVAITLIGEHQVENAQVAEEVLYTLAKQDRWKIDEEELDTAMKDARLPGRMDIVEYKNTSLIIDGAHNIQKMEAFLKALEQVYPGEKHTFLVAFKHGKDIESMIAAIEPLAKRIVVTDFWVDTQDMLNISEPLEKVAKYVKKVPISAVSGPENAVESAIGQDDRIVITGSLYFASEIYSLLQH